MSATEILNELPKPAPSLSRADAWGFLRAINPTAVVALDYELFEEAAIVAAAKKLNCDTLFSGDLADGQNYGGVRVVNPFSKVSNS